MASEKRKIPKSDKALHSLYMSPTTVKNMKGKNKKITWESEKTPSGSGDTYTYRQSKKGAVAGTKKREIRTKHGDTVKKEISKHMSFPNKEGGKDTYRREIKGDYDSIKGPGYIRENINYTGAGNYVVKQNKKGKVLSKTQIKESKANDEALKKTTAELRNKKYIEPKKKKTVKQKTTTYQGKKGDTIKPKTKESTTEYWRKSKKGPGYVPEKKKPQYDFVPSKKDYENFEKRAKKRKESVKNENDDRVQKQIKSGFGDWVSSDNFGKKMKSDFAKKKKGMLSAFDKKKKEQESSFEKKKREMKASFEKKKKSMGG